MNSIFKKESIFSHSRLLCFEQAMIGSIFLKSES